MQYAHECKYLRKYVNTMKPLEQINAHTYDGLINNWSSLKCLHWILSGGRSRNFKHSHHIVYFVCIGHVQQLFCFFALLFIFRRLYTRVVRKNISRYDRSIMYAIFVRFNRKRFKPILSI